MDKKRRDQIGLSLRNMAKSYATAMAAMEQTLAIVCEELSLDPKAYWKTSVTRNPPGAELLLPIIEESLFSVSYCGKNCFLGNSLPFKLLARLARSPNIYLSHDQLLDDVWQGIRSGEALRSVVKTLRNKLRQAGLTDLAKAIDGSVRGHYALRLDS